MSHYHYLPTGLLLQWTIPEPAKSLRASRAMDLIEKYLVAARFQTERIWNAIEFAQTIAHPSRPFDLLSPSYCEIHFYFLCWDVIRSMVDDLRRHSGYATPQKMWAKYQRPLQHYQEGRHRFEHLAHHVVQTGKAPQRLISIPRLHQGTLSFNGARWDISKKSLKQLDIIVTQLASGLRNEAIARHQAMLELGQAGQFTPVGRFPKPP